MQGSEVPYFVVVEHNFALLPVLLCLSEALVGLISYLVLVEVNLVINLILGVCC